MRSESGSEESEQRVPQTRYKSPVAPRGVCELRLGTGICVRSPFHYLKVL